MEYIPWKFEGIQDGDTEKIRRSNGDLFFIVPSNMSVSDVVAGLLTLRQLEGKTVIVMTEKSRESSIIDAAGVDLPREIFIPYEETPLLKRIFDSPSITFVDDPQRYVDTGISRLARKKEAIVIYVSHYLGFPTKFLRIAFNLYDRSPTIEYFLEQDVVDIYHNITIKIILSVSDTKHLIVHCSNERHEVEESGKIDSMKIELVKLGCVAYFDDLSTDTSNKLKQVEHIHYINVPTFAQHRRILSKCFNKKHTNVETMKIYFYLNTTSDSEVEKYEELQQSLEKYNKEVSSAEFSFGFNEKLGHHLVPFKG
jgi:hypothetical protein